MKGSTLFGLALLGLALFFVFSNPEGALNLQSSLFGGLRENLRAFQGRDPRSTGGPPPVR